MSYDHGLLQTFFIENFVQETGSPLLSFSRFGRGFGPKLNLLSGFTPLVGCFSSKTRTSSKTQLFYHLFRTF